MLATWTKYERNRDEIVSNCLKRLKQMYDGTGGQLRATARLLHHELQRHPDPDRIVLDVRRRLPKYPNRRYSRRTAASATWPLALKTTPRRRTAEPRAAY